MEVSAHRTVDVLVGASTLLLRTAGEVRRRAEPVMGPVGRSVLRPPLLPRRLHPATWLDRLADQGAVERAALTQQLSRLLDMLVPVVVAEALSRAGLTESVVDYVDLDAVVAAVDLDAAAARLDVDAVVGRADLDAVAERLDVDAVVRRVDLDAALDRLDLTDVVLTRVDLDAVAAALDVDAVVGRADLDAVAERLDVDAVVRRVDLDTILDRLDLTDVVLTRVDLDVLVAAVLDRVDLPRLAEEVIDEIDLPDIIRESTGSMASDTVQGARMQGISADEAVGRAVDRLLLRRRPRGD